jgi:hypothetical protein
MTHNKPETLEKPSTSTPEIIDDAPLHVADFLKSEAYDGLQDEARLEDLVERMDIAKFVKLVSDLHRSVAPNTDPYPSLTTVNIGETSTARPEERLPIMQAALELAKQVAAKYHDKGGSIRDALRRCGNLLASGVLLAHNYSDGNGRTARVLGMLVQDGYNSSNPDSVADLKLLSSNRDGQGSFPSYTPTGDWSEEKANKNPMQYLEVLAALDVDLSDEKEYIGPIISPLIFSGAEAER